MEVGLPNLPDEIVSDILSRLPVKSLCRFKSVSKTWLARTIDSQFIKLHLSQSMKYSTNQKLIIAPDPWGQISKPFYSIDYQAHDHSFGLLEMPCKSFVQIWGSFNGVILLDIDEEELCLWNPSIRMYRKFSPPKCADVPLNGSKIYGLGYDSISDDIKVIAVVFPVSGAGSVVFVFSSKLRSWERIGDFGYDTFLFEPGCILNGAPHWFARGRTDLYFHIVYFDLVEEKFKEVPHIYEVKDDLLILGVLHGWLCVVDHCPQRNSDVWVMKEYGVC